MENEVLFCRKCGRKTVTDSNFCLYCGEKVVSYPNDTYGRDTAYAPKSPEKATASKQELNTSTFIALAVAVAILVGTTLYGLISVQSAKGVISELETENTRLSETIAENEKTIERLTSQNQTLNSQVTSYKTKADNYDSIISALKMGTMGVGSDYFYVDNGIVYLTRGQSTYITLHTGGAATISAKAVSGSSATLSFTESTWYGSTTKLKVQANSSGVTLYKITNTAGSSIIYVLIIVP